MLALEKHRLASPMQGKRHAKCRDILHFRHGVPWPHGNMTLFGMDNIFLA